MTTGGQSSGRARTARLSALTVSLSLVLAVIVGWVVLGSSDSSSSRDDSSDAPRHATSQPTTLVAPATEILELAQVRVALDRGAVLLDVRTPQEFDAGYLEGAKHADVSAATFEEEVSALDRGATYVVYCASGNRARSAVEIMTRIGFDDVHNGGGYVDLVSDGVPASD